jgi:undecaprenyl-phosphate 4-deoxy-4-formamido-L-arabinose transferase
MERAVSVLVPTYKSPETLLAVAERIRKLPWFTPESEVVFIDDGNADKTWSILLEIARVHPFVRAIRLSRNVGQHAALLAGVREARHPVIATLDDDLQNPPEELAHLLKALTDDVDVVYGVPRKIKQPIWRSVASVTAKRLMQKALGFSSAVDISSFRVFRSQLRDGFNNDLGPGVSLDALLSWSTSRFTSVEVEHQERKTGKSNYNFWKLFRFMLDTVTGFSTVPLRLATGLGLTTIALSVGVLIWVLGRPLITGESVPGFPFLAATIAIFSGTQLLVLGVIGQYIGRMHFRVMNKPTYTIAERTESK